jgi:protein involved in polysaccharide export with SLBB domain
MRADTLLRAALTAFLLAANLLAVPGAQAQNLAALRALGLGGNTAPAAPSFSAGAGAPASTPGDPGTSRLGSTTEAESGATVVTPLGEAGTRATGNPTAVFGAALFTRSADTTSDAVNPNYVISPGDRLSVRVWGAMDSEATGVVDPAGNFFIPNLGPVALAGTRSGDLQTRVQTEVGRIYNQQVQVYSVLLSTQRIGVFVTGFVRTPGRFAGSASDTALDFLVRAGGVDPSRGSYREIWLLRGGRQLVNVDLYNFLLDGRLPVVRMQEGDTLVVGRQRALVGASGAVRNNFLFEVPNRVMSGREVIDYARPLPSATNAIIQGSRGGRPYSRYATLAELPGVTLSDQDVVTFITDRPAQTVQVSVEGSRIGPSVLVVDRDVQLCDLLDYISVDPVLADTSSIYLLRPSVAAQQTRSLNEAADRLERALFLVVSPTQGVANIRSTEASMVSTYLQRARRIQPEGRVVVFSNGQCSGVRLLDGDTIVIPERRDTVLMAGEIGSPRAVVWQPGMTVERLVGEAGGLTARGSLSNIMIRRASGEVVLDPSAPLRPGDEVIALPRLDGRYLQLASDIMQVLFQAALAARVFTN